MTRAEARPMQFAARGPLKGSLALPGDKSIAHRALMLSALAVGESRISNLSEGSDVLSTAAALSAMGARISAGADGTWDVSGVGVGGLLQPQSAFDMGNSGTSARLLMGLVATHDITATFIGDASLSRRPMERVIGPLRRAGARITASPRGRLPLVVQGTCPSVPQAHRLEIASAQVKSALLLAGLNTPGVTEVVTPVPSRDHTERMLKLFGAEIEVSMSESGERRILLRGEAELSPQRIEVPGDPSSAAFLAVAALIVPGSEVTLSGIGANPMRVGLFELLKEMGGDLEFSNRRELSGERVADLRVRHSALTGIDVPPELVPAMIDEFPIFFVAAAFAQGTSRAHGLSELRVKESDRVSAMARGLQVIGVTAQESEDGLLVEGLGGAPLPGGATVSSELDHRVAMSFAVAGLGCSEAITVDDMSPVSTSFPGFAAALDRLSPP
ncbi:MAG TPA: 3-phosphoshikimate 1-carboxyvinyltransferase [Allosphingosinicella sp.]|nr:3-phosphoshikimate 1-carboxyvinyltransferase [Allosphingosinicella sp.]